MALELCILGSGSSGNCSYIGDGQSGLILDAGFSAKEIKRRMGLAGLDSGSVKGIVISHEHSDHTRGAGPLARSLKIPVYINQMTYNIVKNVIGTVEAKIFKTGDDFAVNGIGVSPFSISHDCQDPCAFTFDHNGRKLGFVTDTGAVTTLIEQRLMDLDYMVIESNHDPAMLQAGPYPWALKQRIASRMGHLSNEDCVKLLSKAVHSNLQGVALAHLSKQNNNPDLVRISAGAALEETATPYWVATQDEPGEVITIE